MSIFDHLTSLVYQKTSVLKRWLKSFAVVSPFKKVSNLPAEQMSERVRQDYAKKHPYSRARLNHALGVYNFVEMLSYCAACALVPSNREELSDIEYLATNALEFGAKNKKGLSPRRFYKITKLVSKLKYLEVWNDLLEKRDSQTVSARLENMFVRGTGRHPRQSFETAFRRFEPHNPWLVPHLGFTIQDAILFSDKIIDLISLRMGQALDIKSENEAEQANVLMGKTLHFENGSFAIPTRSLVESVRHAFTFALEDIQIPAAKKEALNNFISRVSGDKNFYKAQESFGDDISLYEKPIIQVDQETYFLPFPSLLVEGLPHFFYTDLNADSVYWPQHSHLKGKAAEQKILDLLSEVFLKDFIFPNPPKKKDEELIDALVLFGDTMIVVESKSRRLPRAARMDAGIVQTYVKENIEGGLKQAQNAEAAMKSGSIKTLKNARGQAVAIDPSKIKKVYSVLILDERLSHMLTLEFLRDHAVEYPAIPYIVDINDLEILIKQLDTPPEFMKYLEDRQNFLQSGKYHTADELDLFGYYRTNARTFPPVKGDEQAHFVTLDGFWESYVEKYRELIAEKVRADEISYFMDSILEEAHTAGQNSAVIAEQLSKLNRMDRRALSTKAYEKSALSAQDGKPHYYLSSFASIDFGIICLFTSEPREKRRERLGMLCALASHKMNIGKVIGIAMEPANSKTTSIDYCQFVKPSDEVDPEMEKLANEIFGPAVRSTENEYPSLSKNI